jgi:hypothetical protein
MTSKEKTIWKSESIYVDHETGEIISRKKLNNGEYIKIKTTLNYEKDGNITIKKIVTECERSKQKRLFY